MKDLNKEIGARIRFIRSIFNEGAKLSASQFAHLLGESVHKILNYELGRAQVSPSFLVSLYRRGINPTYILTGEGKIFAENKAGRELEQKFGEYLNASRDVQPSTENSNISQDFTNFIEELSGKKFEDLLELARKHTAVAGDIMEILKRKAQNE